MLHLLSNHRIPQKQHLQAIYTDPPTTLALAAGPPGSLCAAASGVITCLYKTWTQTIVEKTHVDHTCQRPLLISMLLPGIRLIYLIKSKVMHWWKSNHEFTWNTNISNLTFNIIHEDGLPK